MPTLKLTEGEIRYLAYVLIDNEIEYDEFDGVSCYQKVLEATAVIKPNTKPKAAAIWEALKGVVG